MAYSIKNTRNTEIDSIANNTLKITTFGIRIPGKNYSGYGEAVGQSLLHILENFACPNNGSDQPNPSNPNVDLSSPAEGQLWYDTTDRKLRIWDPVDGAWKISSGAAIVSATAPTGVIEGDLWWNTTVKQLFGYDGSGWVLIGPPNPASQINKVVNLQINSGGTGGSTSDTTGAAPTGGTNTNALGILSNNTLVGLWSNDTVASPTYYYTPLNDGSSTVRYYSFNIYGTQLEKGSNTGENTNDFWFNGKAKAASTADAIGGLASTVFMRNDNGAGASTSRIPTTGSLNMGDAGNRWGTIYATTFNGTATAAQYADLAERYHADDVYTEGTVVKLGGVNEITETTTAMDADVFGIISTKPAYAMNEDAGSNETHPYVALAGRIPVKVAGKVNKGQRLVSSSIPGVAIAADTSLVNPFIVIGRALEDKDTEEVGLIEAVVGAK